MELLTRSSRRRFITGLTVAFAGISALVMFRKKRPEPARTSKFLTQDGRLVEVPVSRVTVMKKKATTRQIKSWIWKQQDDV